MMWPQWLIIVTSVIGFIGRFILGCNQQSGAKASEHWIAALLILFYQWVLWMGGFYG